MSRPRTGRVSPLVLALAFGSSSLLAVSGCGGGSDELVTPVEPPAVKAKDSMDYYKKSMATQKKGSGRR